MAERVDLRGRGGAAFPVAASSPRSGAARKRKRRPVVLVNGAEGEPGSAKDKMLLLRSPYLVLGGAVTAARALQARDILVAVNDGITARSVREAAAAEPVLRRMVGVVEVPDRFVAGESGALVNAVNGHAPLPPGARVTPATAGRGTARPCCRTWRRSRSWLARDGGTGGLRVGRPGRRTRDRAADGWRLGRAARRRGGAHRAFAGIVLDLCAVGPAEGVLVGGYHGCWLPEEAAYDVPVSRAGLAAAGGTLGAGIVLALGQDTCPLGEVAQVAAFLAKESSGQCGPCKLGLPGIARSLAGLADGSGGGAALDTARRGAAAVRGRGACSHPDGAYRFVMSALDVFTDDLAAHVCGRGCGRPVRNYLPLPAVPGEVRLEVDWTRCRGHGLCAHIVPELVQLDEQGYPVMLDMPVPPWLEQGARRAADMCPGLALRLTRPALPRRPTRPSGDGWAGR